MPETFLIEAYSGPLHPQSLWTNQWKCGMCSQVHSPSTTGNNHMCPLHNPLYCTGKVSGERHPMHPCDPLPGAEVFPYTSQDGVGDNAIGRIPIRRA